VRQVNLAAPFRSLAVWAFALIWELGFGIWSLLRSARNAALLLLALAPFFPGCRCQPPPGESEYREGLRLFLRQQYGTAEPHLRAALVEELPGSRVAEIHYMLGAIALRRGSAHDARSHFLECLRQPTNEELRINASLGIARSHYQSGEYRHCREACADILRAHRGSPRVDEVCFLMAEASRGAGLPTEAQEYYRKVAAISSSRWAEEAKSRLHGGAPPPQAAILPAPAVAAGEQFLVQVAALRSITRAADEVKSLRAKGYPAIVCSSRTKADGLHAVQVGPYATRDEAQRVAARLKADGFGSPAVKPAGEGGTK